MSCLSASGLLLSPSPSLMSQSSRLKSACSAFIPRPAGRRAPGWSRLELQMRRMARSTSGSAAKRRPDQRNAGLADLLWRSLHLGSLIDPLSPMRTVRQMLDKMDRIFKESWSFPGPYRPSRDVRAPWAYLDNETEVRMRFDMPEFSNHEVKVSVESDNVLVIRAENKSDSAGEDSWTSRSSAAYNTRLVLFITKSKVVDVQVE